MSFSVKLYYNKSDDIKVDKDIELLNTFTGVLKDSCSILDPQIMLEGDVSSAVLKANYLRIEEFGRYYYIVDRVSIRNGVYQLNARVDVLMSHKEDLLKCTGVIRKQQKDWNLYLNDGSLKIYQNPKVITKAFPSGFTSQSFVLAVAGG